MNVRGWPWIVFFALTLSLPAGEISKVSLTNLPAVVQHTIQTQVGTNRLGDIEQEEEEGEITYTVTVTRKAQARTFSVDTEGFLLSAEIGLEETPVVVRKTIEKQLVQGELVSVEKMFEDGVEAYEVEMTTADRAKRSFTVATNGILARLQMQLAELPAAVQKTIEEHLAGGKLGELYRVFEDGELSYEANYVRRRRDRDFRVAPDGRLRSEQVFLTELLPAAQRTIEERIAGGKILRIDQVFELKQGVFPYEVSGRKEGKAFDFAVGTRGRFLGMDE